MSQIAKRKPEGAHNRDRKRVKIHGIRPLTNSGGKAVRGDALKWNEVSVDQYLDDAEGFFGLEEIDDVEVVKGEDGKGTFFRPLNDADVAIEDTTDSGVGIEDWSGFDDESIVSGRDVVSDEEPGSDTTPITSPDQSLDDQLATDTNFAILDQSDHEKEVDVSAWTSLNLHSDLLVSLSRIGFDKPTRIQEAAIPLVNSGKDVIGKAVTGSGKTLAFGLPIISRWLQQSQEPKIRSPAALILAPTRELAHQITKHLTAICQHLVRKPRIVAITGGLSVLKQQRQLENADIVVGTPGRLWEVMSGSNELLDGFKRIKFLVADEADRLLSEGHFAEVEEILDALDREVVEDEDKHVTELKERAQRQTLVFSATFNKELQQKLATKASKRRQNSKLMSDKQSMEYLMHKLPFQDGQKPMFVDANPDSQMAENLSESILECGAMQKDLYLYAYLMEEQARSKKSALTTGTASPPPRILVFTNSVSAVKRLVPFLQSLEMPATTISPLHSNMEQKARLRSLERFAGQVSGNNHVSILVATDVAARGLDIQGITTIVHYHVPRTADTYVHRSGRTARVNNAGNSILLCSPEETASVTKLIAKIYATSQVGSKQNTSRFLERIDVSPEVVRQVSTRVDLAQKIIDSNQSVDKVNSEGKWLRAAADDLGVDYDSEDFEAAGKRDRRGRGRGKEKKQRDTAKAEDRKDKLKEWRAKLKADLQKRIDFGNGHSRSMRYLAGGAFDVDQLLQERSQS